MRRFLHICLLSMAALLSASCLAYPPTDPVAFDPEDTRVASLALGRPVWDGTRPDDFCQPDIGDDIRWQLKDSLQKRGYRVVDLILPPLDNSNRPDPLASLPDAQLSAQAPDNVDAVFRLRIVEFLDDSLCDSHYELKSLDIAAVAEIYDRRTGMQIWQTRQLCSDISRDTRDAVYSCTVQLAQRITARLPRATGGVPAK